MFTAATAHDPNAVLKLLLEHAPIGFAYIDRGLRFVMINDRLAEINGLSVQAHLGRTVGEVVPSLLPAVEAVTGRILNTHMPVLDHEFTGHTAKNPGQPRRWRESWYPVPDALGEIAGFGVLVEEISAS